MSSIVYLREAVNTDIGVLFDWVNNSDVRNNAFNSGEISYTEHKDWFNHMMNSDEIIQYIMVLDGKPIGQIRLNCYGEVAEIDYSIDEQYRGQGYGDTILKLIIEKTRNDFPRIRKLVGKVKINNYKSEKCFINNGFIEKKMSSYKQYEKEL